MNHRYRLFDPVLAEAEAAAVLRLCEGFGSYGMYSQEAAEAEIGQGLAQRHDAVMNFLKTGGRHGKPAALAELVARTNYFREEYAYGDKVKIAGDRAVPASRRLRRGGARHPRPAGDRAGDRVRQHPASPDRSWRCTPTCPSSAARTARKYPQWLMVVMHHSGLFDEWRMPIVTAVSWFNDCRGGEFVFYPDGAGGPPVALPAKRNTAIILDTDTVFHGVDPVAPGEPARAAASPACASSSTATGSWSIRAGDEVVARYGWDEHPLLDLLEGVLLRRRRRAPRLAASTATTSISTRIVDRLVDDLRARGRIPGERPAPTDLALTDDRRVREISRGRGGCVSAGVLTF